MARAAQLDTPRGRFAALDARPAGPATGTALLLPGYTGSKEDFLAVLAPLTEQGYRVVAVDLRGQYESPPASGPEAYALGELAADVLVLVEHLGDGAVHVLGHSFGGLVARAAVLERSTAFRSLTLLGSGPAAIPGPRAERLRLLVAALPHLDMTEIRDQMEALERADGRLVQSAEIEQFLRARFLANCSDGLLSMGRQLLDERDRTSELLATGVPVHVVYGEADDAWPPPEQADMARRLGAREAVVPRAAHSPAAERPAETAAVLAAFWQDVDADGPRFRS